MSFLWRVFTGGPPPWEGCCFAHDRAYWRGGPKKWRLAADIRLMECVVANGHPHLAVLMFIGVRVGGMSWLPFPSLRKVRIRTAIGSDRIVWRLSFSEVRWGYGWPYPQYQAERDL